MRNRHDEPVKLGIFVGSPRRDMEHVRSRIIKAILEVGHVPDGMELWAADARPTRQTIAERLELCDVHVVILGPHYGSQVSGAERVSFTHWEYIQSRDSKRPIIAFLLEQNTIRAEWRKHDREIASAAKNRKEERRARPKERAAQDREEVEISRRKYMELWKELREKSVSRLYKSPKMPGVERDVVHSINTIIDNGVLDSPGWIRAKSKAASLAGKLQGNRFLMKIMERVIGFRATSGRVNAEDAAKKAAADMFMDTMMNRLAKHRHTRVFLESGSSLAFVSEALEERIKAGRIGGWDIATNNALALMQLMLFYDGKIERLPPEAPDPTDPYGAIFTKACREAYEEPPVRPRSLSKKELEAIKEIIDLLKSRRESQIILATASGWDTTHKVRGFRGPHVGSHANMLFKRAVFMTGNPIVLFLNLRKVDNDYPEARFKSRIRETEDPENKYCYPVFGPELPLEKALRDVPLAICIGYQVDPTRSAASRKGKQRNEPRTLAEARSAARLALASQLGRAGFDMDYAAKEFLTETTHSGAILVANAKFSRLFPSR